MLKKSISAMAVAGVLLLHGGLPAQADVLKTREPQTTSTGAIFYPDDSHPELGNAWRDPSGMIWGDIVRESDSAGRSAMVWLRLSESLEGQVSDLDQEDAKDYCEDIGASLPSSDDFRRLRAYMGCENSYGLLASGSRCLEYHPQILPNLDGKTFWTSDWASDFYGNRTSSSSFYGGNGLLGHATSPTTTLSVRCVTL